ncbi:MAG: PIN domain nuclease [Terracidiphilus sp.]|jgi:predicted nucleic acid-binding protein
MVIVDTSVWIDFLNQRVTPETTWLRGRRRGDVVGLTTLVLAEILQGIRMDTRYRQAQLYFRAMPVFDAVSRKLAERSAHNFRTLRALGFTIRSTMDCVLATFCIENGHRLLHGDRDFAPFEHHLGLAILHP